MAKVLSRGQKAWETRRRNQSVHPDLAPSVKELGLPQNQLDLLTLGETADALLISYPTLHSHLEEITPAPKKLGKRFFFTNADLPALREFFQKVSPPDSPARKAWATRRSGGKPTPGGSVLSAYLEAQQPGASAGIKAKATRMLNDLANQRAKEGKNPNMVRAGIKAQASRCLLPRKKPTRPQK